MIMGMKPLFNPSIFASILVTAALSTQAAESYVGAIRPLIKTHCLSCHSTNIKKGGLDLEQFGTIDQIRADIEIWETALGMIERNEMPPNGKKQFDIKQKYERLKVEEEDKEAVHKWFKINPGTRNGYPAFKKMIRFPDYFPAIRDIVITNKKLYVRTYKKREEKTEFFIFSIKGKLLEKVFIPIYERNKREYYSYSICDGKVYQFIENEDTAEWELHVTTIAGE